MALTLRRIIKDATKQDVRICQACLDCELALVDEMDIPLGGMIQMVLFDDEEVLTSRTLWSQSVFDHARNACKRGLDLEAIMKVLREEAQKRDLG